MQLTNYWFRLQQCFKHVLRAVPPRLAVDRQTSSNLVNNFQFIHVSCENWGFFNHLDDRPTFGNRITYQHLQFGWCSFIGHNSGFPRIIRHVVVIFLIFHRVWFYFDMDWVTKQAVFEEYTRLPSDDWFSSSSSFGMEPSESWSRWFNDKLLISLSRTSFTSASSLSSIGIHNQLLTRSRVKQQQQVLMIEDEKICLQKRYFSLSLSNDWSAIHGCYLLSFSLLPSLPLPKQSQIFKNAFKRDVFRASARLPLAVPECQPETHWKIRRAHDNYFMLKENRWFGLLQILVRVNVSFSELYWLIIGNRD